MSTQALLQNLDELFSSGENRQGSPSLPRKKLVIKRADINRLKRLQREENPFPTRPPEDRVFGKRRLLIKSDRQSDNSSSVRFVATPGGKPVINKKLGALF